MKKTQEELRKIYQQQKTNFLDSLQPDDFRNASSFNHSEIVVEKMNEALHRAVIKNENTEDFITKAASNIFRENSSAIAGLISLSLKYLEMKQSS